MENEFKGWEKDYKAFLETTEVNPPENVSRRLVSYLRAQLNPAPLSVLGKLGLINLVTGLLTLTVCPQFGVGPIGGGHGIMHFVMQFGDWLCAIFCGGFYMGTTALVSLLILSAEEARVVRRHQLWQFSILTVFSFVLLMFSGKLFQTSQRLNWDYLGIWIISAIFFAQVIFQFVYHLRFRQVKNI